ncbi:histidine phosphatase family protein [Microlunatus soli]|uniref:histidine phosphatase family protein n=1 Tax=Microlunatus soli TaxID=630515 RepID=UPI0012F97CD4|nr:histidine phosphatase family protein [Microlunatus soli]
MLDLSTLENSYTVMRHAQSRPNVAGLIVCRAPAGLDPANGLTELGRRQARDSASSWAAHRAGDATPPVIISSDFSRTTETAEILREVTGAGPVRLDRRLRERDFGGFDGGPASAYDQVWARDAEDATAPGVEPTGAVRDRVLSMITDLEREHRGRAIVLVSHGDTSQITQAAFAGLPVHTHRTLPPLGNAELRALNVLDPMIDRTAG